MMYMLACRAGVGKILIINLWDKLRLELRVKHIKTHIMLPDRKWYNVQHEYYSKSLSQLNQKACKKHMQ